MPEQAISLFYDIQAIPGERKIIPQKAAFSPTPFSFFSL
jgi:hypothetical protein